MKISIAHSTKCPPSLLGNLAKSPNPTSENPRLLSERMHQKTLAKIIKKGHENLTLHDWIMVFAFIDQHPRKTQGDVAKHFVLKSDGTLIFMQCTLSRKMKCSRGMSHLIPMHFLQSVHVLSQDQMLRGPLFSG